MMHKPGKTGFSRLIAATGYSAKGFRAAWRHEEAFRIEACLALIFLPAAFFVTNDLTHQLLLVVASGLVIMAELINSAIEAVVDRISHDLHPLSGQDKDLGSATVFVSLVMFVILWSATLWHFFSQLTN